MLKHLNISMNEILSKIFLLTILGLLSSSCSRLALMELIKPPKTFAKTKTPQEPDYSQMENWHKWKKRETGKEADVFYIHPTTYILGKRWNQDLNDEHVNWRTRVLPLPYQAAIFYENFRMFIPKYRQAIFYSFVDKKGNGEKALELAYQDIRKAFYNYWENHNAGRPFIIAAHSQGSYHSKKLLAEIMQDSAIKSKMVVSYIIGWPISASYLKENPQVEVCSTGTQTGCIVSWNTESGDPKLSLVGHFEKGDKVLCVNPLSWTLDTTYVPKTQNLGSLQYNKRTEENELILHYCDAQIKNGTLKITPPANQKDLQMPMGKGNYHLYDYTFFFQNIKQNARERTKQWTINNGQRITDNGS